MFLRVLFSSSLFSTFKRVCRVPQRRSKNLNLCLISSKHILVSPKVYFTSGYFSINQDFKICENIVLDPHPIKVTTGTEYPTDGEYSQPITEEEFEHTMKCNILPHLRNHSKKTFLLACSGGSDSISLYLLLERWIKKQPLSCIPWNLIVCTVDHKLRPESATEAAQVHSWMKSRGVEHYVLELIWPSKPTSRVQEICRRKRYAALCWLAKYLKIDYILTAHHCDDQIETFFFRLSRLSGVDGLACMRPVREFNNLLLFRPLLPFSKARIIATNRFFQHPWIEDPTNSLMLPYRNRIRTALKEIIPTVLSRQNIVDLIEDLASVRDFYAQKTKQFIQKNVIVDSEWGFVMMSLSAYQQLDYSIAHRVLSRLIAFVCPKNTPSQSNLRKIHMAIHKRLDQSLTIGTCLFRRSYLKPTFKLRHDSRQRNETMQHQQELSPGLDVVVISRTQASRRNIPQCVLKKGCTIEWDQRWRICYSGLPTDPDELRVRALVEMDRLLLLQVLGRKKYLKYTKNRPTWCIYGLPVIEDPQTGEIVAIPHFQFNQNLNISLEFMNNIVNQSQ